MKIGVQLPEVEYVARWPEMRAMGETAEAIGLDSVWVGDHLLYQWPDHPSRGPWEAWSTLAALAAVTERVELGPLVAATSFHNPAMIAKKAATIDQISGGRVVAGIGSGWAHSDFAAVGVPFSERNRLLDDLSQHNRASVRAELDDVLTGVGMWGRVVSGNDLIGARTRERRAPRLEWSVQD
jgi:alkanesulfonate monooxygenase SsuD/methylene tetrahydromethanopterin reductase-like flavin-dependent oxidoreductase (luciferase family)